MTGGAFLGSQVASHFGINPILGALGGGALGNQLLPSLMNRVRGESDNMPNALREYLRAQPSTTQSNSPYTYQPQMG
jgi:hypothetical protein